MLAEYIRVINSCYPEEIVRCVERERGEGGTRVGREGGSGREGGRDRGEGRELEGKGGEGGRRGWT